MQEELEATGEARRWGNLNEYWAYKTNHGKLLGAKYVEIYRIKTWREKNKTCDEVRKGLVWPSWWGSRSCQFDSGSGCRPGLQAWCPVRGAGGSPAMFHPRSGHFCGVSLGAVLTRCISIFPYGCKPFAFWSPKLWVPIYSALIYGNIAYFMFRSSLRIRY